MKEGKIEEGWVVGLNGKILLFSKAEAQKKARIMGQIAKGIGVTYRPSIPIEIFGLMASMDPEAKQWAVWRERMEGGA